MDKSYSFTTSWYEKNENGQYVDTKKKHIYKITMLENENALVLERDENHKKVKFKQIIGLDFFFQLQKTQIKSRNSLNEFYNELIKDRENGLSFLDSIINNYFDNEKLK